MVIALGTFITIVFFCVATLLHALSLERIIHWSFRAHMRAMGILWNVWNALIIFLVVTLPPTISIPSGFRIFGFFFVLLGLCVFLWHRKILGWQRFMGGRFFDPRFDTWVHGGLYRYLKNPIYDAMSVIFIGLFLWRENFDFLVLAFSSLLLFNVFLGSIENVSHISEKQRRKSSRAQA